MKNKQKIEPLPPTFVLFVMLNTGEIMEPLHEKVGYEVGLEELTKLQKKLDSDGWLPHMGRWFMLRKEIFEKHHGKKVRKYS